MIIDGKLLSVPMPLSGKLEQTLLKGTYEQNERIVIKRILGDDDIVLELGAGIGCLAVSYGKTSPNTHIAVEANSDLLNALERNLERHNCSNVDIVNKVASCYDGQIDFYKSKDFYSSSALKSAGKKIRVEGININELIEKYGVTVIISDIEGFEYQLFGRVNFTSIEKLIVEVHAVEDTAKDLLYLLDVVKNAGFKFDVHNWRGNVLVFRK